MPKFLTKSKLFLDEKHWQDYQCLWLDSKIPYSDGMVEKELDNLQRLMDKHPGAVLVGHSLGAWWSANLACRPSCFLHKLVLWTPLIWSHEYNVFNVSHRYNPCNQTPNPDNTGPHKVLVCYGTKDLIVPHYKHSALAIPHFNATSYSLEGGHLYQSNHKYALEYMKDWLDI